jgi:molecular chaperone GrpE
VKRASGPSEEMTVGHGASVPPEEARPTAGEPESPSPESLESLAEEPAAEPQEVPEPESESAATPAEPDYKDRWLRAEAEFQNFRRRATREWEEGRRSAEESVFMEIVAAIDDLERALAVAAEPGAAPAWSQGVALVAQRLRDYLARQGVRVVDPVGQPFDPKLHEALLEVDAPQGTAPGSVVQVAHKGYARGERALRPARVVVARQAQGE